MNSQKLKHKKINRRKARTRAKVSGTAGVPRFSVYRSLKHIYAQLINDENGRVLAAASDSSLKHPPALLREALRAGKIIKILKQDEKEIKKSSSAKAMADMYRNKEINKDRSTKIAIAFEVGKMLAEKARDKKIKKCVFDKGAYKYHGRVKAVAEGAREGGLKF